MYLLFCFNDYFHTTIGGLRELNTLAFNVLVLLMDNISKFFLLRTVLFSMKLSSNARNKI